MINILQSSGIAINAITSKDKNYNAFMVISVDSHSIYYSKAGIKAYCQWALNYFGKVLFLIVDLPQMYNYSSLKHIPLPEAKRKAEEVGQDKKRALEKVLRDLRTDRISIQGFKDFNNNKQFQQIYSVILEYFNNNSTFTTDLLNEMSQLLISAGKITADIAIDKNLANFLIDEISACLYISEFANYPIEIAHQEEFVLIKNIYNDKYKHLRERLSLKGNIGYIQTIL